MNSEADEDADDGDADDGDDDDDDIDSDSIGAGWVWLVVCMSGGTACRAAVDDSVSARPAGEPKRLIMSRSCVGCVVVGPHRRPVVGRVRQKVKKTGETE